MRSNSRQMVVGSGVVVVVLVCLLFVLRGGQRARLPEGQHTACVQEPCVCDAVAPTATPCPLGTAVPGTAGPGTAGPGTASPETGPERGWFLEGYDSFALGVPQGLPAYLRHVMAVRTQGMKLRPPLLEDRNNELDGLNPQPVGMTPGGDSDAEGRSLLKCLPEGATLFLWGMIELLNIKGAGGIECAPARGDANAARVCRSNPGNDGQLRNFMLHAVPGDTLVVAAADLREEPRNQVKQHQRLQHDAEAAAKAMFVWDNGPEAQQMFMKVYVRTAFMLKTVRELVGSSRRVLWVLPSAPRTSKDHGFETAIMQGAAAAALYHERGDDVIDGLLDIAGGGIVTLRGEASSSAVHGTAMAAVAQGVCDLLEVKKGATHAEYKEWHNAAALAAAEKEKAGTASWDALVWAEWMLKEGPDVVRGAQPFPTGPVSGGDWQGSLRNSPMCVTRWAPDPSRSLLRPPVLANDITSLGKVSVKREDYLQYHGLPSFTEQEEKNFGDHSGNFHYCPTPMKHDGCAAISLELFEVMPENGTVHFFGDSTCTLMYMRILADAYVQGVLLDTNTKHKQRDVLTLRHPTTGKQIMMRLHPNGGRTAVRTMGGVGLGTGKGVLKDYVKPGDTVALLFGVHYNTYQRTPAAHVGYENATLHNATKAAWQAAALPARYRHLFFELYYDYRAMMDILREGIQVVDGRNAVRVVWGSVLPQFFTTADAVFEGLHALKERQPMRCKWPSEPVSPIREYILAAAVRDHAAVGGPRLIDAFADIASAIRGMPPDTAFKQFFTVDCTHACVDLNDGFGAMFMKAFTDAWKSAP